MGQFRLEFPRWRYPNRDGTADGRRSHNAVIHGTSTLTVAGFVLWSADPLTIYDLALRARRAGHAVARSAQEDEKRRRLHARSRSRDATLSAQLIADTFAARPIGFEEYCAELFRAHGYDVRVTAGSRDGGFDLDMSYAGARYLGECKCYAATSSVGRPHLQKLVGANAIERAHGLFFITTARFSPDAIAFAHASNIELIDGARLVHLAQASGVLPVIPHDLDMDGALTRDELLSLYPADLRDLGFHHPQAPDRPPK